MAPPINSSVFFVGAALRKSPNWKTLSPFHQIELDKWLINSVLAHCPSTTVTVGKVSCGDLDSIVLWTYMAQSLTDDLWAQTDGSFVAPKQYGQWFHPHGKKW